MKKGTIRKLLATSVLACIASGSQAADVEWWSYQIDMKWTAADFDTATAGFEKSSYSSGLDSAMLSWGAKSGINDFLVSYAGYSQARSSLYIAGDKERDKHFRDGWNGYYDQTRTPTTYVNMFRHTNNAIPATTEDLRYAQLTMSVELKARDGNSYVTAANENVTFDMYFYETPNTGGNNCPWGSCNDDLFVFSTKHEDSSIVFDYDNSIYSFDYFITGVTIELFNADTCSIVSKGALTGACYGFRTFEGTQNTLQLGFSIASLGSPRIPVPEPETYAMLLAGLGVIGAIVRRRNNVAY
ncbi:MAG: THxN family PEP-CTERM protein [Betaproteobacteria bacterium]|nr:THxN family PEP-CTERM protein [Betaproteobacteria bacterium]